MGMEVQRTLTKILLALKLFFNMKNKYFPDLAPRNGSNKPDTLLLVGTVAMIVTCGMIFISVVLMGY